MDIIHNIKVVALTICLVFSISPQIRNPTKVSERCGPNRQECDFSSLD